MAQITHPLGFQDLEDRLTVTVEEAASLLSLGRTAAYEAARRGEIPTRRLGRRLIVPVPALLAWLGAGEGQVNGGTT
jgi:excisionase family DNA binding protein